MKVSWLEEENHGKSFEETKDLGDWRHKLIDSGRELWIEKDNSICWGWDARASR